MDERWLLLNYFEHQFLWCYLLTLRSLYLQLGLIEEALNVGPCLMD